MSYGRKRVRSSSTSPLYRYSKKAAWVAANSGIGYVAGGPLGAATMGIEATKDVLAASPKKNSMPKDKSAINLLAGRASMKKYGKVRPKGGKKKTVKVSRKLKEKIEKVISQKHLYGEYKCLWTGTIGTATTAAQPPTITVGSDTGFTPAYFPLTSAPSTNNWSHWNAMVVSRSGGSAINTAGIFTAQTALVFFTPLQILNAASVLWNKKTNSTRADQFSETGNLTTRVNTNVPDQTAPANVKVEVVNSFVEFTLKNNSMREVVILARHCVPKLKFATETGFDAMVAAVQTEAQNDGPLIMYPNDATNLYTSPLFDWRKSPAFAAQYKYETIKIVIKPGETCTHSIQGPRNYTLDYAKLWANSQDQTGVYNKNSVTVTFSVMGDLETTTYDSLGNQFNTGRFINTGTTSAFVGSVMTPIAVEVKESFKLRMPEPVGFVENGLAAGTSQILTLRAPKKAYYNFSTYDVTEATNQSYYYKDEENPLASVVNTASVFV